MANYVMSKVICDKEILETYLIDWSPIDPEEILDEPYISFNKLFGVQSWGEYVDKIGTSIYYGFGFSWTKREDGRYEVKFATRWEYPIQAILRLLELSHEAQWFVVEENHIYVSKFYWDDGVKEDIMWIDYDDYDEWCCAHEDFEASLADSDDSLWYYLPTVKENWKT